MLGQGRRVTRATATCIGCSCQLWHLATWRKWENADPHPGNWTYALSRD